LLFIGALFEVLLGSLEVFSARLDSSGLAGVLS
jgi:hypothetical protein